MEKYSETKDDGCGFAILGFPCNQFNFHEPGQNPREIINGIKYVRPGNGFEPAFRLFDKLDVNGANENLIYTHLKKHCPLPGGVIMKNLKRITWEPVRNDDISWNFEKFLIDEKGFAVMRFLPALTPLELTEDIEEMIAKCSVKKKRDGVGYMQEGY